MGRRSRKRSGRGADGSAPGPAAPARARGGRPVAPGAAPARITPERRARLGEAPPAPWAPVPLTELAILGGMVLLVVAFVGGGGPDGLVLGVGLGLVGLASIELALREHLAGYRSHSTLIAATVGVALVVLLATLTGLPRAVLSALGLLVAGVVFVALRRVFRGRAGGLGFRA